VGSGLLFPLLSPAHARLDTYLYTQVRIEHRPPNPSKLRHKASWTSWSSVDASREMRTAESFQRAIALFQETLDEHPGHAAIQAHLAEVCTIRVTHAVAPVRADLETACRLATDAVVKSPNLWRGHIALAAVPRATRAVLEY
jgi:hypothetical protein